MAASGAVNERYLNRIVAVSETVGVEATEGIVTGTGVKLVAKGARIDARFKERLLQHKRSRPLESSARVMDGAGSRPLDKIAEALRTQVAYTMNRMNHPSFPTLLLVHDEALVRSALRRLLRQDGYQILDGDCASEGLAILAKHTVQVVVSDQRMPGDSGTQFLGQVKATYPHTTRMLLAGQAQHADVTEAIENGTVHRHFTKPWDNDVLRHAIREAFSRCAGSKYGASLRLAAAFGRTV